MKMLQACAALILISVHPVLRAQVCDPSLPPSGLSSNYTPGSGLLLEWDAVPGSVGVQLQVIPPSGTPIFQRRVGPELDHFLIPEGALSPGVYSWRVLAACSTVFPFDLTPVSAKNEITLSATTSCPATMMDIDGNLYSTVQIGSQCWMAENLKVERFRNGESIPTGFGAFAWSDLNSSAFVAYGNIAANKDIYGLLYNWFAAVDARGLCPDGWQVPTDIQWTQLTDFLGGDGVAGGMMKSIGTLPDGTGLWRSPNTAATNSSGFTGLPGGYRNETGGFNLLNNFAYWWSSSEGTGRNGRGRKIAYNEADVDGVNDGKQFGFSIRCIQE